MCKLANMLMKTEIQIQRTAEAILYNAQIFYMRYFIFLKSQKTRILVIKFPLYNIVFHFDSIDFTFW